MKFTVVLPVYNVSNYIQRCLISCVRQSYRDIEIIVVDDCGVDDSIQKAEQFAEKDSRIKIIRNPKNLGTYHARRVGVQEAIGEYILFLDPDDALEIDAIEKLSRIISKSPDLIFCGVRVCPSRKFWQMKTRVPLPYKGEDYKESINKIIYCRGLQFGTPGKIVKKSILIQAYLTLGVGETRRIVYGEDVLLFAVLLMRIASYATLPKRVYIYHLNHGSITLNKNVESIDYNIGQLNTVSQMIMELPVATPVHFEIKETMLERLFLEKLRLRIRREGAFFPRFENYFKIFLATKSFRDLFKLLVFTVTLGRSLG